MALLTRTDANRNLHRFYILKVMPTLFGDWAVLRE
jgi:predicted DNA-binding WGR domain protein